LGQFGFRRLALQQRPVLRQIRHRFLIRLPGRHELLEPRVFLGQFLRALLVVERLGIAQGHFNFRKAAGKFIDVRF
jgi:hypothetical protein